jgi:hypothetical protein
MAPVITTLPEAKARAKRAHQAARAGDTVSAALYDRIYATALTSAANQPAAVAATMYVRTAVCLKVHAEMKGWPAGTVAGLTVSRRVSRIHAGS